MRADDMTVGESYALVRTSRVKVTYLDTPADVRARRRVRVRFETGVPAGHTHDVATRNIEGPWDRQAAPTKPAARSRAQRRVKTLTRRACVGDAVVLSETGELTWTVTTVDERRCEATIVTQIFGQPQRRTVPIDVIRVRTQDARQSADSAPRRAVPATSSAFGIEDVNEAVARLRPIAPRREIDELMDDVLFTEACLWDYAR
ncbi:MAG: hypothetical protein LC749_04610 [Actinobacteria bacterium]|nr:hypothetical protein [Actinomycetota bacterium]